MIFTTRHTFSSVGMLKDVLPMQLKSSVLYQYTPRCERAYIGKTTQQLLEWVKQHVPDEILQAVPERKKVPNDSAITKHLKASVSCIVDARKRFSVLVQVLR